MTAEHPPDPPDAPEPDEPDEVDEQGLESFPASDPPETGGPSL